MKNNQTDYQIPDQELFSTADVAKIIGTTISGVTKHIDKGNLKSELVGRSRIIKRADLLAFLEARRSVGRPPWMLNKICEEKGVTGDYKERFIAYVQEKEALELKASGKINTYPSKRVVYAGYYEAFFSPDEKEQFANEQQT